MATITYQGLEVLYTASRSRARRRDGRQITHDLNGESSSWSVFSRARAFLSTRALCPGRCHFDFVAVSSYGKVSVPPRRQAHQGPRRAHRRQNVLIVEDILDTGLTLSYLRKVFSSTTQRPCASPPARQTIPRLEKIEADYVGFSIPTSSLLATHGLRRALPQPPRHLPHAPTTPNSTGAAPMPDHPKPTNAQC